MQGMRSRDTAIKNTEKIPLGISRCLLGEEVRFNGGHKLSKYCRDQLSDYFDYRDSCPEVEIGMGIPREPIRLVEFGTEAASDIRILEIKDASKDYTKPLSELADKKQATLSSLRGFIFMQGSPSYGKGAFAGRLMENMPWLPVEEAGRLMDSHLRENFITRVFVLDEWMQMQSDNLARKDIIDFHSTHKYLVMAHSQKHYKLLGKLLARAGAYSIAVLATRYRNILMHGLKQIAGIKGNANALQHMQGYLKRKLNKEAKADLSGVIESYRLGEVPLIAPLTLLRHYAELAGEYYAGQSFLAAHPKELGLNNSI